MQYPCSRGRADFEQAAALQVCHFHFKTIVSMHTLCSFRIKTKIVEVSRNTECNLPVSVIICDMLNMLEMLTTIS